MTLTHLQQLEAEGIHIMREMAAETERPLMLYSIGNDSSVMLHLARKAFHPAKPPFPLLHGRRNPSRRRPQGSPDTNATTQLSRVIARNPSRRARRQPEIRVDTATNTPESAADQVIATLEQRGAVGSA